VIFEVLRCPRWRTSAPWRLNSYQGTLRLPLAKLVRLCFPHEAKKMLYISWLLQPASPDYDSIRSNRGEGIGFLVLIDYKRVAHLTVRRHHFSILYSSRCIAIMRCSLFLSLGGQHAFKLALMGSASIRFPLFSSHILCTTCKMCSAAFSIC